jgi:hypothetical protein
VVPSKSVLANFLFEAIVPGKSGQQKVAGEERTTKLIAISHHQVGGKEPKVPQAVQLIAQLNFKVIDNFFRTSVSTDRVHGTEYAQQRQA